MKADIEVSITGRGSIALDGVDISGHVRGFSLYGGVGRLTELSLELIPKVTVAHAEVEAQVSPELHSLLVHLGWTPPVVPVEVVASGEAAPAHSSG